MIISSLVKGMFNLARAKKPTVILIDEIDSLCGSRDVFHFISFLIL